jgi:VanZ family protein
VRRQVLFCAAVFWSVLIIYFCLKNANDLRQIDIEGFDKFIHIVFHFVFTLLWFLYVRKKYFELSKKYLVQGSFFFSFIFGVIIEILQELVTTTRSADFFDILANFFGAFLAMVSISLFNTNKKKRTKI